jgi:hypothetical protein
MKKFKIFLCVKAYEPFFKDQRYTLWRYIHGMQEMVDLEPENRSHLIRVFTVPGRKNSQGLLSSVYTKEMNEVIFQHIYLSNRMGIDNHLLIYPKLRNSPPPIYSTNDKVTSLR